LKGKQNGNPKAKELRDKLQEDILSLIQKFEGETETHVHYVNLDSIQMLKKSFA